MAVTLLGHNTFSMRADADLSAAQYRIVAVKSDEDVELATDSTYIPVGVLCNKPTAGKAAEIAGNGCIVKCEAGATIAAGDRIQAVAGGRGSAAAGGTNVWTVGQAKTAASGSGAYFELIVSPSRGVQ